MTKEKFTEQLKDLHATEQALEHRQQSVDAKLLTVREKIIVVNGSLAACANE